MENRYKKKEVFTIAGKTVTVYVSDRDDAPIVFSNDFEEQAEAVLAECKKIDDMEFHLVSITGIRWDEELSPWASAPVATKADHFTGEADVYLQILEEKIVPQVRALLPHAGVCMLNGYSMGGLFALYAAHNAHCFAGFAAPSGSVWYPDFLEYAKEQKFAVVPKAIYLSLGDTESRTRNPYLSQTQKNMEALCAMYTQKGIAATFVSNPGNHFKNVEERMAKGIIWTLKQLEQSV